MAYEDTVVPVHRSQEAIRDLFESHGSNQIAFITDKEAEGLEAFVQLGTELCRVRILATVKAKTEAVRRRGRWVDAETMRTRERRRVWRVLYHHLKAMFVGADEHVVELRTSMLPFVVTRDGATVADALGGQLARLIERGPARLLALPAKGETTNA